MKATINTKQLLATIQSLVKIIPMKSVNPMLENILVMATKEGIGMRASDLETTITVTIPAGEGGASIEEEGLAALPARFLLDIVKQVEDSDTRIVAKENSAEVIWEKGQSTIPAFNPKDYPDTATSIAAEDGVSFDIPGDELVDALNATLYATGDDQIRPVLNGILLDASTEGLTLVASDSHRLALRSVPQAKADKDGKFILHRRQANILKNLADGCENVKVRFDDQHATLLIGNASVSTRGIVGKYPNYKSVIPANNTNELQAEPQALIRALKRVSVCSNRSTNHIKLTFKPDIMGATLEIEAVDNGFGTAAYEKMGVEYTGAPLSVGFKAGFLIEMLDSFGDAPVRILLADERRAVLALPAEKGEGSVSSAILMPIMVA